MFYKSIASVYDYIFPQNINQLKLIDKISTIKSTDKILDIGCATGNLTELLSSKSNNVIGLDLDDELLMIARNKYNNISFKLMNMLDLEDNFEVNSIDKIISFGNTLVHLPDRENVKKYFESVYKTLNKNGVFIVQIINYDRIINNHITNLSTIDNKHIKFIRDYDIKDEYVDFNTELLIKSNNHVIKNSISLLILKESEIRVLLTEIGFKNIEFYGSLKLDKLTDDSVPLIFSCFK